MSPAALDVVVGLQMFLVESLLIPTFIFILKIFVLGFGSLGNILLV